MAAGSAPFVLPADSEHPKVVEGLSVEIWASIAQEAGLKYEIVRAPNVAEALRMLQAGQVQAAVGPIGITAARTSSVSFSQPYFRSKKGIVTRPRDLQVMERVSPFLSTAFMFGVGTLMLVLFIVGNLIWILERKENDQFPQTYVRGVGNGIWLALVTMTTVGYGDKAPITISGRVVTGIWMVISMITASSLTASIATALTLAQIEQPSLGGFAALKGHRVAAIHGTTSHSLAKRSGARVLGTRGIAAAIKKVLKGDADAVVSDLPVLRYHLLKAPEVPLELIETDDHAENYGFAFSAGSALRNRVDRALLGLIESGEVPRIERRWFQALDAAP